VTGQRLDASKWTPDKQARYERFLRGYAAIAEAIQRKYRLKFPWLYADLTAGSGRLAWDGDVIQGSPLIALRTFASRPTLRVRLHFVERDADRMIELRDAVAELVAPWTVEMRFRITYEFFAVDNAQWFDQAQSEWSQYGLLYWDGLGQDVCPMDSLNQWMRLHRLQDLLVMASGCAPKRVPAGMGRERLDVVIQRTIRRHLWIAKPETAWQWTFALMSNYEPLGRNLSNGDLRFADYRSREGEQFLSEIGTTRAERFARWNPGLFDAI
jgi:hypothetical protein